MGSLEEVGVVILDVETRFVIDELVYHQLKS